MDIDQKRIVLCRRISGIGKALLLEISRQPAQVVAVGRDETRLQDAILSASALRAKIIPFKCDLTRREEVDRLFEYVVEQMCGIDMFFANAGFGYWERIGAPDWGRTEAIFRTNVYSPIYAAQKMEALFPGADYRVVITSSILGRIGLQGYGLYAATKATLDRFAEVYRLERGKRGQLVLVYLLAVRSGFLPAASGGPVPCLSQSPEDASQAVLRGIKKAGRRSTPRGSCRRCCWSTISCPSPGAGIRRSTAGSRDGTRRLGTKRSQCMSEGWANPHLGRSVLGLRHLNAEAQQAVRRQTQTFLDELDYLDRS